VQQAEKAVYVLVEGQLQQGVGGNRLPQAQVDRTTGEDEPGFRETGRSGEDAFTCEVRLAPAGTSRKAFDELISANTAARISGPDVVPVRRYSPADPCAAPAGRASSTQELVSDSRIMRRHDTVLGCQPKGPHAMRL
jgi:hypothetical protein